MKEGGNWGETGWGVGKVNEEVKGWIEGVGLVWVGGLVEDVDKGVMEFGGRVYLAKECGSLGEKFEKM